MIVVVEGPTAAGKSTWTKRHAPDVLVRESRAVAPGGDPTEVARFWARRSAARWRLACSIERTCGVAVCETDPLKLHYAWSLWRIGAGPEIDFVHQAVAYRTLVERRRIGLADAFLVAIPDAETLVARADSDDSRRRRNRALHIQLREPLREWYGLVERLRPGSVHWTFPERGVDAVTAIDRDRYDLAAFDRLVDAATQLVRPIRRSSAGRRSRRRCA